MKKILILALGGEGGGTLTEWIVEASLQAGWPIQATSIPGVAQRTGATSYYIECLPQVVPKNSTQPPMCLAPLAGDLDLILSSELLESGRAIERGMSDANRTQVITSSTRTLTIDERTAMGDARFSSQRLIDGLRSQSKQLNVFDMHELARREGTVVSAVMFGAFAASGVIPFSKLGCESIIERGGDNPRTQSSLKGFRAGFNAVEKNQQASISVAAAQKLASVDEVLALGMTRLAEYQDLAYANQYRDFVNGFKQRDHSTFVASQEAARALALWMAYEDVIRVADLKSRKSRFEQIRLDYKAKPNEPIVVRDFLKPGVDEIAAIMPPSISTRILAWAHRNNRTTFGEGVQLSTNSIWGLISMRFLANLKFLRRRSSRFIQEQQLIVRWVAAMNLALEKDPALALVIAGLPRLIKGYSDTFARGRGNFVRIFDKLIDPRLSAVQSTADAGNLTLAIQAASAAALADPESSALLQMLGLPKAAVKEQVIHFARPKTGAR
jgi:indolepyruvate ferredoxin oxidoreductase, beta subunit